ncbi:2,3-diaminopropionate biosynthesis protein SbnA [Bacillus weihaiensis]|uniref:2,3-diaminopropionate biosynthesis protein SbnA n=1 Tax=Bacillus weihaiensis TaxID=1547283 RepID=UPI002353ADB4|nr:2,3-diaminopropionate biosynthesis protein SbnA [Bacillus weihaiensis]
MLSKLYELEKKIKDTPIIQLEDEKINLFAKLEYNNLMGSVKIRPAVNIIKEAIGRGDINERTVIIESSSGNLAVALALICISLDLKFIAVIDKNTNSSTEILLQSLAYAVHKIEEPDHTGGYLINRLQKVKELLNHYPNTYWTNQYENHDNYLSHYYGIGNEIADFFSKLDYIFVGVSSGGTITGVSMRVKEKFPNVKVIAVDVEGSAIFGTKNKKRNIPGLGSSIVPNVLQYAKIDEVIHITELDIIDGNDELLKEHFLFAGASSGTVYKAIKNFFQGYTLKDKPNVVFICPDTGWPYIDTIYNQEWIGNLLGSEGVLGYGK